MLQTEADMSEECIIAAEVTATRKVRRIVFDKPDLQHLHPPTQGLLENNPFGLYSLPKLGLYSLRPKVLIFSENRKPKRGREHVNV